jgi:hypothetical protein
MDTAITFLLCGTAAAVLLVAAPPLLRAAGVGPEAKSPTSTAPARSLRAGGTRGDRQFFEGDHELEDDPRSPRRRSPIWSDDDEHGQAGEGAPQGDAGVRVGLVRRHIKLFEHPGAESGDVIGEVGSGETVMLVTEVGDWVLVVHSGSRDVSMGWTRKSDIAVR